MVMKITKLGSKSKSSKQVPSLIRKNENRVLAKRIARDWSDAAVTKIYRSPSKLCGSFQMEPGKFDPRHSGELLKHMDKQNEVLMETHRSMLHELQKLQVEEEMLMRKLHEVMSAHDLTKQNDCYSNSNNSAGAEFSNKKVNAVHEEQKGHNFG